MARKTKTSKKTKAPKKSTKSSKQTTKKRRYSKGTGKEVGKEMRRYKKDTAKSGRSGKGGKVKSRKQAIAIGLSKARILKRVVHAKQQEAAA